MPGNVVPPKVLLHRPGNRQCADCGRPEPRWASVNLGILVCEVCAGIHRKLGTHISVVRSVTIDSWKPEWLAALNQVGNERARAFYEQSVPESERYSGQVDLAGGDKLDSAQSKELERWIRAKYEEKRYAPSGVPAPCEEVAARTAAVLQGQSGQASATTAAQASIAAPAWPQQHLPGLSSPPPEWTKADVWPRAAEAAKADAWPPVQCRVASNAHKIRASPPVDKQKDAWASDKWSIADSPAAHAWELAAKQQDGGEVEHVRSWQAENWPDQAAPGVATTASREAGRQGSSQTLSRTERTFASHSPADVETADRAASSCFSFFRPMVQNGLKGIRRSLSADYTELPEEPSVRNWN